MAVAELHAIGIVHGDLSSENILLDPKCYDAKLIDFDIASREGEKVMASGNVDFASPTLLKAIEKQK